MEDHRTAAPDIQPARDASQTHSARRSARSGLVIEDFHDVLIELVHSGARFLIVGAHALSAHGVPRATVDLDIWIRDDSENAQRVYAALAAFGAPLEALGLTPADFEQPAIVTQFGLPPLRIDVMTSVSGLVFDEAWSTRVEGEVEGVRVPILGRESFIKNKRASGRTKDLADIELLAAGHEPE